MGMGAAGKGVAGSSIEGERREVWLVNMRSYISSVEQTPLLGKEIERQTH